jgi:C_GCAxxG_C_C family probable redox protein
MGYEKAVTLFKEGFNCSQSVCAAFAGNFGFTRKQAMKVASAFGGGMGRNNEVCGAVAGALMVIGMKYGRVETDEVEAKERCYTLAREFFTRFREKHENVRCTELLGCDISTREGIEQAREQNLFNTLCTDFVGDAALILEELLER